MCLLSQIAIFYIIFCNRWSSIILMLHLTIVHFGISCCVVEISNPCLHWPEVHRKTSDGHFFLIIGLGKWSLPHAEREEEKQTSINGIFLLVPSPPVLHLPLLVLPLRSQSYLTTIKKLAVMGGRWSRFYGVYSNALGGEIIPSQV